MDDMDINDAFEILVNATTDGTLQRQAVEFASEYIYRSQDVRAQQAARIRKLEAELDALRAAVGGLTPEAVAACVEAVRAHQEVARMAERWPDDRHAYHLARFRAIDKLNAAAALLGEPADAPGDGEREV